MKTRRLLLGAAAALAMIMGAFVSAQQDEGPQIAVAQSDSSGFWFVEMTSPPTADGTSLAKVRAEKAAFRRAAAAAGVRFQERYAFDTLWNGLSVAASRADAAKMSQIQGVKAVYPVVVVQAPEPPREGEGLDLVTALAMTGADIAQSELGYTGAGVKVAVMDTGIDYDHLDLGGCFGEGCRVAVGWDFVGDLFNADATAASYNPTPVPDPDPDDCAGHGSHVAGIVGANGAVKGVAPGVTFGAYRVFGCQGSTFSDIMIAAMERALADGMHVLNMSIGSAYQWPEYPTAAAATRLVNKKVIVVASIGNNGANGLYSAGAPGLGDKVIGVASYDNTHANLAKFTISPDDYGIGYTNAAAAPPAPLSGSLPMARTGTPMTPNDACNPLLPGSLTGRAVLIRRGTCTFYVKSLNAQNAGAAAVVLYNNSAGRFSPTVAGTPPITIPVVAISDTEGVLINDRLAVGPVTLTWTDEALSLPNPTGGLISSFSSYGLSPDLQVKPDIGAPGGLIRSTYPLELGGYANLSGTSMASPHVAGAVALLLEAKPRISHQAVRAVLQNSADPGLWWGNPALGFLDNVHRQGAGMLDIDDAILATTKIEPGKLSLGEGEAGPAVRTLKVENNGSAAVTYGLSYVNALSTGGVIAPSFHSSDATVTFSSPTVTVPAGGSASVTATITPATGPPNGQYGGYIVFTPQGGGLVYRVPFAGFVGDYQGIQVLVPTANGFPWVAKLVSCTRVEPATGECIGSGSYANNAAGVAYTATGTDFPYFAIHFEHQARSMKLDVYDLGGKAWHRAIREEYLPRNSTGAGIYVFFWNGTTTAGNKTYTLPDGAYIVKLSLLKALGDSSNPAHWETWMSPVINIDRP